MSTWTILLGLFVLILIPRMLQGRTPQEPQREAIPRWRRPRPSPRDWTPRR
ncbi:MAG TPA: hypothetical protein VKF41_07380 [Bryobacteraceae bacterium]|nr:hypothetical protein [Bryobacteraceae bacterium]